MGKEQAGYILLILLGLFLTIVGIQGNVGTVVAILFTPDQVDIQDN
jgi:hypothetical protein